MTENVTLNQSEIMELIPHREPLLLIDSVVNLVSGVSGCGVSKITGKESYLAGHFPGNPIVPGVLTVEAMAQTAAVIIAYSKRKEGLEGLYAYFTSIDKTRFRAPVYPGDTVHFEVKVVGSKSNLFKFDGKAMVGDRLVASSMFSAFSQAGKIDG